MSGLQAMHNYVAVVVMIIAFHEVVITQGWQMKALNQHHIWINKGTNFVINVPTSAEMAVNAISNKDTNGDVSAYRPTTPGNSPGVGHRKSEAEDKDMKEKVVVQSPSEVEYSLAEGSKTDFRPTDPGHSPGVGHSAHQKKNDGEVGRVQN